jgi:hypothetical protein
MRADRIRELIRKRPFAPIRLCLTDGGLVEIRHPEQVLVTSRDIFVALAPGSKKKVPFVTPASGDDFADDWILIDPIHVVSAEPVNGRGSRTRHKPQKNG